MYSFLAKFAFAFVLAQVLCTTQNNADIGIDNHLPDKRARYNTDLPHLVQFGYITKFGLIWHCSGALISPTKVVTTASCINKRSFGTPVIVRVNDKEIEMERYTITSEVAVIFLKEAPSAAQPACLSPDIQIKSAVAAGWGGLLPDNQLHATVNNKVSTVDLTTFEIFEDTIKLRPTEESICVVDQGGPLQVRSRRPGCLYDVIGILREWKDCGHRDSFGEYIILASYIKWIEE